MKVIEHGNDGKTYMATSVLRGDVGIGIVPVNELVLMYLHRNRMNWINRRGSGEKGASCKPERDCYCSYICVNTDVLNSSAGISPVKLQLFANLEHHMLWSVIYHFITGDADFKRRTTLIEPQNCRMPA